jgi:hypothetical protein
MAMQAGVLTRARSPLARRFPARAARTGVRALPNGSGGTKGVVRRTN